MSNEAQKILSLIESVDHTNDSAMIRLNDEIYEWLLSIDPETKFGRFVNSRDALKAIRPDGWSLHCIEFGSCSFIKNRVDGNGPLVILRSDDLYQEELAELHAIIQAIEYERTQK